MKDDTRKRLSQLILDELSEKIKRDENLGRKFEPFADLPVEKVADAVLKQFEYLLSSELRDLIIHLIEQEVASEEAIRLHANFEVTAPIQSPAPIDEPVAAVPELALPPKVEVTAEKKAEKPEAVEEVPVTGSIMEHFGPKEPFPTEPMDIELKPDDWFYLYGFSYAPDSTGKGIPSKKLSLTGIDGSNKIFILDYGDVRFFMNKMTAQDYSLDRAGKPTIASQKAARYKLEHEKILNNLRAEDFLTPLPFWTIMQGRANIINKIEDQYVALLRALIDIHDAVDWDIEVFAFDQIIIEIPAIAEVQKTRTTQRETKHQVSKGRDVKILERLIMREKSLAQEIHSQLLIHSAKAKIDYIIRLDNAFMDDWKSILAARYTVGKEKRKNFCQTVRNLQNEYAEYQLMLRMTNPGTHLTLTN